MPDGPMFSDQPVGDVVQPCDARQAGAGGGGPWDVPCILKILCNKDASVVSDLSGTQVTAVDSLTWDDLHFDGAKWVIDNPVGLGGYDHGSGELVVLHKQPCEDAATTMYHELIHKHQPPGIAMAGVNWPWGC